LIDQSISFWFNVALEFLEIKDIILKETKTLIPGSFREFSISFILEELGGVIMIDLSEG
jgi:hypothetical protein